MIKLIRPEKPLELTLEIQGELTDEYNRKKSNVWRKKYIIDALLDMSQGKCCYCETNINTQGNPMHVEHFRLKDIYPQYVVEWTNLLPSCGQCNVNKGKHDITEKAIINPTIQDPREYIYTKHGYLYSKDNNVESIGRFTIELLDLNNRKKLIEPRMLIFAGMYEKLIQLHSIAVDLNSGKKISQKKKNQLVNGIEDLLDEIQPDKEYSGVLSAMFLSERDYLEIKNVLTKNDLWSQRMKELEIVADKIALDEHE